MTRTNRLIPSQSSLVFCITHFGQARTPRKAQQHLKKALALQRTQKARFARAHTKGDLGAKRKPIFIKMLIESAFFPSQRIDHLSLSKTYTHTAEVFQGHQEILDWLFCFCSTSQITRKTDQFYLTKKSIIGQ